MKKSTLFVALSVIAVSVLIWACNKPKVEAEKTSEFIKKLSSTTEVPFTCDVPSMQGDMMYFASPEQYECYHDFLADVMNGKDENDSTDINDVLDSLEASMGFTSLRKVKYDEFEAQNAIGWATQAEIPLEDWINNKITRSVLSPSREVRVGDAYLKYLSADWVVAVDAGHPELLNQLGALGDNPSLEDILALDLNRQYISISSLTTLERNFGSNMYGDGTGINNTPRKPTADWQISGTVYAPSRCDNSISEVRFEGFTASYNLVPNVCKYRIYPRNGVNPDSYYIEYTSGSNSVLPLVTYTYPAAGNYMPKIEVYAISPYNSGSTPVATLLYNVTVKDQASLCSTNNRSKVTDYSINSNFVIRGFVEFHCWTNFPWLIFNSGKQSEFDGWTELHELKNGHWNRRKAKDTHLCINLVGDMRFESVLGPCYPIQNSPITVYKCTTNSNQLYAENQFNGHKYMHSVEARHEVAINGGVSGYFTQTITACD